MVPLSNPSMIKGFCLFEVVAGYCLASGHSMRLIEGFDPIEEGGDRKGFWGCGGGVLAFGLSMRLIEEGGDRGGEVLSLILSVSGGWRCERIWVDFVNVRWNLRCRLRKDFGNITRIGGDISPFQEGEISTLLKERMKRFGRRRGAQSLLLYLLWCVFCNSRVLMFVLDF
jgi:hypothetical protein